jgi:hypothetical protein
MHLWTKNVLTRDGRPSVYTSGGWGKRHPRRTKYPWSKGSSKKDLSHSWAEDREGITMAVEGGAVVKPTWLRSGLINTFVAPFRRSSEQCRNTYWTVDLTWGWPRCSTTTVCREKCDNKPRSTLLCIKQCWPTPSCGSSYTSLLASLYAFCLHSAALGWWRLTSDL